MRFLVSINDDRIRDLIPLWIDTIKSIPDSSVVTLLSQRYPNEIDGHLTVELVSGRKLIYGVECKRHLAPVVEHAVAQARRAAQAVNGKPLIMAAYISQPLGERLRGEGVDYIDTHGNASFTCPPLCILLRQNITRRREGASSDLNNSRAGLQLLALLLTEPRCAQWPLRSLSQAAGISLGAAHGLKRDLQRNGTIRDRGSVSTEIFQRGDLLEHWGYSYVQRLRPKLLIKTYRTTEGRQVADLVPLVKQMSGILVGGELAADITTGLFRASRVSLHISPDTSLDTLAKTLRLLPDIQGNVDVLTHFGRGPVWETQSPHGLNLIADPLVYGELLIPIDDRLREARGYYQTRITKYG